MSFIATAAAGLAAVGAGVSLYGKYKEGSSLEDTDWSGLMGDTTDMFQDNISNLRDRAAVVFDKIETGWETATQSIGDKATTMWDQAQNSTGGFAVSGEEVYANIQAENDANRQADILTKERNLSEEQAQLQTEQEELALVQDYESEMASLEGSQDSSKGWYPGKNIKKLFS